LKVFSDDYTINESPVKFPLRSSFTIVTFLLKNLPRKTSIANLIPRNTNLGTQYQENLQFLNNEIVGEEALLDQYNHLAGEWAYEI